MFDYFLNASCTSLNKEFSFTKINIKTCLAIIFQNKHKIYLPCIHNSFYTEMSYYISYLNKLPYLQAYRVYRLMKDYDLSIICHFPEDQHTVHWMYTQPIKYHNRSLHHFTINTQKLRRSLQLQVSWSCSKDMYISNYSPSDNFIFYSLEGE